MKVKAIREHNNTYGVAQGGPVRKAEGTEYELPDAMAKTLIEAGLVEPVKEKAAAEKSGK